MVIDTLREQWARIGMLDEQIGEIERRLKVWLKEDRACQRIADIPGVGLLTATAAVATMAMPRRSSQGGSSLPGWAWSPPERHGWANTVAGHQQAWGYLSAHAADARRSLSAALGEGAGTWIENCANADRGMWWSRPWPTRWRVRSGLCWLMSGRTKKGS